MNKKKIVVTCCVTLFYLASIGSVRAFSPQPGTVDDPLISVSYLNQVVQPLLDRIASLEEELTDLGELTADLQENAVALAERVATLEEAILALPAVPVPAPVPVAPPVVAPVKTVYGFINASWVNIRSGPGTNFAVLALVPNNTQVEILGQDKDWYKIRHKGSDGFVHAPLLRIP